MQSKQGIHRPSSRRKKIARENKVLMSVGLQQTSGDPYLHEDPND